MRNIPLEIEKQALEIGCIGNYYGGLKAVEFEGKHYWAIENWDGHHWQEIPESLYNELIKFSEGGINE